LTIHATCGEEALKLASVAVQEGADTAGVLPPKLIAITLLTSLSSRQLAFELKIPLELPEYALQMALMAQESGLDGAVCSPQEVANLRQTCGDDFLLVCPGVRPSWATMEIKSDRLLQPKRSKRAQITSSSVVRSLRLLSQS
jgi:orotidine-5'-phosphate decarboxylase